MRNGLSHCLDFQRICGAPGPANTRRTKVRGFPFTVVGVYQNFPTVYDDKVAVIGAGTMGGGIAMCFLNAGVPVVMLELS